MAGSSPPTNWCRPTSRTSPTILTKIRNAKPDMVVSNLAGVQITNFLKQYSEFGLDFPVAGFGFDTAVAWGAGKGNFFGTWPLVWHHLIDTPGSKAFVAAFTKKYNKPPENQAWGDYIAMKILAKTMNDAKSTDALKIIEHWEKEPKFDVLKTREGYFRNYDHQLMHEMYAVEALKANELKNQWDIYKPSAAGPGCRRAARGHRRHAGGERLQYAGVRAAHLRPERALAHPARRRVMLPPTRADDRRGHRRSHRP